MVVITILHALNSFKY